MGCADASMELPKSFDNKLAACSLQNPPCPASVAFVYGGGRREDQMIAHWHCCSRETCVSQTDRAYDGEEEKLLDQPPVTFARANTDQFHRSRNLCGKQQRQGRIIEREECCECFRRCNLQLLLLRRAAVLHTGQVFFFCFIIRDRTRRRSR